MYKNEEKAFTLAEVLITLGIIGIVAAMTIPTLMNNIADTQYKVALKKNYSILTQAYESFASENGSDIRSAIADCSNGDNNCLRNILKTKLNIVKECDKNQSLGTCFPDASVGKQLNGTSITGQFYNYDAAGLILSDGASLNIYMDSPNCTSNYGGIDRCGWLTVDVNGFKKPNTWGKDIYLFIIGKDKLVPSGPGIPDSAITTDDCVSGGLGFTCASKYLLGN